MGRIQLSLKDVHFSQQPIIKELERSFLEEQQICYAGIFPFWESEPRVLIQIEGTAFSVFV